jgi:hypothetical protein
MRRLPLVLFVALGLFAAACSDDGGGPAASADPDPGAGVDGGAAADAGEAASGDGATIDVGSVDFPIPVVADPVVFIESIPGVITADYPVSRYEEILAFYTQWVSDQPGEWSPTPPDTSEGSIWFSLALEGEPGFGRTVTLANNFGPDDDRVGVVLGAPEG